MHALEKETATHSSILAWRISGTEEPGGLPSMRSHRVGNDWSDLAAAAEGSYVSMIKAYMTNPQLTLHSAEKGWKLPLRSGKKQGCPLPPFLFNSRGSISQNNLSKKKQKQIGKEDIKLSLFADDIILCIENPKDSRENLKTQ